LVGRSRKSRGREARSWENDTLRNVVYCIFDKRIGFDFGRKCRDVWLELKEEDGNEGREKGRRDKDERKTEERIKQNTNTNKTNLKSCEIWAFDHKAGQLGAFRSEFA
jgi:hypothetical protein